MWGKTMGKPWQNWLVQWETWAKLWKTDGNIMEMRVVEFRPESERIRPANMRIHEHVTDMNFSELVRAQQQTWPLGGSPGIAMGMKQLSPGPDSSNRYYMVLLIKKKENYEFYGDHPLWENGKNNK
jgi:hypothetical protein